MRRTRIYAVLALAVAVDVDIADIVVTCMILAGDNSFPHFAVVKNVDTALASTGLIEWIGDAFHTV